MFVDKRLVEKWKPILESEDAGQIKDPYRRGIVARLLENQKNWNETQKANLSEGMLNEEEPANVTANVAKYDPVMISMVRRAMPNLIAYDIMGVQAMTGPTGLIFALRPKYVTGAALGDDAFYNEADTDFSGTGTQAGTSPSVLNDATPGTYTTGTGLDTDDAELLSTGASGAGSFAEMGFEIEKVTVTAKSRALKANFSIELSQDLKQVHGLDAETEISSILSSEILAEINREMIRTIYVVAKPGAQNTDLTTAGTFDLDLDSNGRWSVEKFKGLMFQIEREANTIARETRRGKGNVILCSSDVASALAMAGLLDTGVALKAGYGLEVDDAGNTFAGVLNGKYKVFIDPYHVGENFLVVGYRGMNAYDAGVFYAPYIPLQMFKTIDSESFQPKMGYKTRYGIVANPFAQGVTKGAGALTANANVYYRRVKVTNLTGAAS